MRRAVVARSAIAVAMICNDHDHIGDNDNNDKREHNPQQLQQ